MGLSASGAGKSTCSAWSTSWKTDTGTVTVAGWELSHALQS